jgi:hypothetical protein
MKALDDRDYAFKDGILSCALPASGAVAYSVWRCVGS